MRLLRAWWSTRRHRDLASSAVALTFSSLWDMMDVLLTLVLQTTGTSFAFFGSGGFGGCVGAVGTVPVNLLFLIPLGFLGLGPPPP